MRDIRFRVWDTERKIFVACINDVIRFGCESVMTIPANCNNYTIQQFTGLKDKNNKEIYEGDIVKASYSFPIDREEFDEISDIYEIKWQNSKYGGKPGFELSRNDERIYGEWPRSEDIEIIGNIFENPELLKP